MAIVCLELTHEIVRMLTQIFLKNITENSSELILDYFFSCKQVHLTYF